MSALPYYIDLPVERQAKARETLSKELGVELADLQADAVCEQVWNALVGHRCIEKPEDCGNAE